MRGDRIPSRIKEVTDRTTGRKLLQLTDGGINTHLYFTENSFSCDGKAIYYLSDAVSPDHVSQIYHMNLETGVSTQLTEEPQSVKNPTKTPDDHLLAYRVGGAVKVMDLRTWGIRTVYQETNPHEYLGQVNINRDQTLLGFTRNEFFLGTTLEGANYSGFFERYVDCKDGRVTVVDLASGRHRDVFRDTCQVAHFQFSPLDPNLAMFCHEGPWNFIHQRIWLLDIQNRQVWPCFRQGPDDCVGHEFWTHDGHIFFDNRRKGHDGTISSDKTQVVTAIQQDAQNGEIPYFGIADTTGTVIRTFPMPYYCNHYHANADCSLFVGDAVEDIVLIHPERKGDEQIEILASHHTTWKYHWTHCHPCFSYQGDKILYAAGKDDHTADLYLIPDVGRRS
jgi:oligogalacturonide lyase